MVDNPKFTNDKGTQIVLSLLKAHGIRRVIASPGTTNIALVASMQRDPWFEMYSAVDERGAAYMACGMAAATGEPVVITCTGATASRNYYSGMTEAYYRKLPVLAITGSHGKEKIGNLEPQVIDRSVIANDACLLSVSVDKIADNNIESHTVLKVNEAILELKHHGGGPVHIDLRVGIGAGFSCDNIPEFRKISRYENTDTLPEITSNGKIAVFIGSHSRFSEEETRAIERFCEAYNAVVLTDVTCQYKGKYAIAQQLALSQHVELHELTDIDLLVHIGEVSGDYYTLRSLHPKSVWRVSEDGGLKDLFGSLTNVFEMRELDFFNHYSSRAKPGSTELYDTYKSKSDGIRDLKPELPFSNPWIADNFYSHIQSDSIVHLAIVNTARACYLTDHTTYPNEIRCNFGGFGIDGAISTAMGSALVNKDKIHYLVIGDLAFFYDMNALGNRHYPRNMRILLVNNACGTEFRNYDHPGSMWGENAKPYIAAAGHFGNKSSELVKNYASSLDIKYLTASNKTEFKEAMKQFTDPDIDHPVILEVFTDSKDESDALQLLRTINMPERKPLHSRVINKIKDIIK